MAGKNLPKAPNDKPLTDGRGLDGRTPNSDDAANAANKSRELGEFSKGRAAGKRPG